MIQQSQFHETKDKIIRDREHEKKRTGYEWNESCDFTLELN